MVGWMSSSHSLHRLRMVCLRFTFCWWLLLLLFLLSQMHFSLTLLTAAGLSKFLGKIKHIAFKYCQLMSFPGN